MWLLINASSQRIINEGIKAATESLSSWLCVRFLLQLDSSMSCSEKNTIAQKGLLEGCLTGKPKGKASEQVISLLKCSQSHCFHCIQQSTVVFLFCTISHCPFTQHQVYTLRGSTELSSILFLHRQKRLKFGNIAILQCLYFYFEKTQI